MLVGRLESRWGLVLAGGEGKRCRTYWRARYDDGRPKQFCSLGSERTLLQETLDRANLYAPPSRTVLSICECHQRWRAQWEGRGLQVTAEPRGADTGPAVIQATHFIHRKCASAVVVLFPSDHAISDDVGFIAAVNRAATWVQRHRDRIIALAVPARGPETGYGWLLPDDGAQRAASTSESSSFGSSGRLSSASTLRLVPISGITPRGEESGADASSCDSAVIGILLLELGRPFPACARQLLPDSYQTVSLLSPSRR